MTSVGWKLDNNINTGGNGPYVFRLHGELIHQAGSLLPPEAGQPIYSQLYIYDSEQALDIRMAIYNLIQNSHAAYVKFD